MGTKLMVPANPPLPTVSSLPFQPEAGIQISKWITDTLVGLRTPCTSQKAGSSSMGRPLGGVKVPAGIDFAKVMDVSGKPIADSGSQLAARATGAHHRVPASTTETAASEDQGRFMISSFFRLL
jgi:hypothetical protein